MDIIDLGCGTGLCGELFRPFARHQIGIDLAPKMIEKSRARGVYDELEEQDVTVALAKRPRAVDLILAADVFIYVGGLDSVFEAAAGALRPGGLLAFTIESEETGAFTLRASRRYAHSARYIRQLASTWSFSEVSMQDAVIRTEKQVPMQGKVIVLRSTAR
jgi:predicted TPR repeat methyltransferase